MPTPQDKKRQSLKRDRRNCFGENDKSSRKSIRRRKALVNRAFRRATRQSLQDVHADPDSLSEKITGVQCPAWRKFPDQPLGDQLRDKLIARIANEVCAAGQSGGAAIEAIETGLLASGTAPQAVADVMRQLRGMARARWSTSYALSTSSTPLHIEFAMARTIGEILNRRQA